MSFEQIFHTQAFRIFIVFLMGIGSYVYFEEMKKLGFEGKYALLIGLSLLLFGVLASLLNYSFKETIDYFLLKDNAGFACEKLFLSGYAFTIYAGLFYAKMIIKKLI